MITAKTVKLALPLAALLALLLLSGCSDDDPASPEGFAVTITVADPVGNPVSGLDLTLVPDTPFYQDGLKDDPPGRARVSIRFSVQHECQADMTIEDIEGQVVRRLISDYPALPGVHNVSWNGLDDAGEHQASGVYTPHLVLRDAATDTLIYEARQDMLMAIIDPARVSVGTTDEQGRIILDDRRLFPALYAQPGIPAVDETGEEMGTIRFTGTMRFYLSDLTHGGSMRFDRDIHGSMDLQFEWDPAKNSAEKETLPVSPILTKGFMGPVHVNRLYPAYPCPFN